MIFEPIDLVKELNADKKIEERRGDEFLTSVKHILANKYFEDVLNGLDHDRFFNLNQIRQICIKYRLRFLDIENFKGAIPEEAKQKLRTFKDMYGELVEEVKIVAPADLFHLENKDSDPLLFIRFEKDCYYLIHKWGNDLSWHRRFTTYIFRSLNHFMGFLVIAAWVFAQMVPIHQLPDVDGAEGMFNIYRLYIFSFTLISFCSFSVFALFTFHKNFSDQEWKSKYLS